MQIATSRMDRLQPSVVRRRAGELRKILQLSDSTIIGPG
jgi:hypothetical protein